MIHEEEPFAGRLLTGFLDNEYVYQEGLTIQLRACNSTTCRHTTPSSSSLRNLVSCCVVCGSHFGPFYTPVAYKKARIW
jgi:hypothetical protein